MFTAVVATGITGEGWGVTTMGDGGSSSSRKEEEEGMEVMDTVVIEGDTSPRERMTREEVVSLGTKSSISLIILVQQMGR